MLNKTTIALAQKLLRQARLLGIKIVTAESCTGGLLAAALTAAPGASAVFERGFIAYSNEAKNQQLGVPKALLKKHGAVSGPVALAMARGALKNSAGQLAISITGIAGPSGGTKKKPVGLIYIGLATHASAVTVKVFLTGSRAHIRQQTVQTALKLLQTTMRDHTSA